tara:strand:+ start:263 stop:544 length:282 start_codon:yes stop_codon:yes gene_type:complete
MAKGGRAAKDSKKVPKGGKCFMKYNSNGSVYRVCKSGAELKFEKERAKKNKAKRSMIEEKKKQSKKLDDELRRKKAELKKVEAKMKKLKSNKK